MAKRQKTKIERGDVYWVENRLLENSAINFDDNSSGNFHPVVVMDSKGRRASVRVMTSKMERYDNRGIVYKPASDVRLNRDGVILTIPDSHQRIPLSGLQPDNYLGNVGGKVLKQIRKSERKEVYGDLNGSWLRRLLWIVVVLGMLAVAAYVAFDMAGFPSL